MQKWIKNILGRENKQVQWAYSRKVLDVFKEKKVWLEQSHGGENVVRTNKALTVLVRSHDMEMQRGVLCKDSSQGVAKFTLHFVKITLGKKIYIYFFRLKRQDSLK